MIENDARTTIETIAAKLGVKVEFLTTDQGDRADVYPDDGPSFTGDLESVARWFLDRKCEPEQATLRRQE